MLSISLIENPPGELQRDRQEEAAETANVKDIYLPWMVGPFFFFSAPNSKCLQRPKFFILRHEHFSHFIFSVIFLVTCHDAFLESVSIRTHAHRSRRPALATQAQLSTCGLRRPHKTTTPRRNTDQAHREHNTAAHLDAWSHR
jgi:hypothetical protein